LWQSSGIIVKTFVTATVIGVALEAALIAAFIISGGVGPCGPVSDVSGFVLAVHEPGFSLLNAVHIGESPGMILLPAAYAVFWTGLAFFVLAGRGKENAT
jgi:uncharacterized RDD family membrane protein YckC